MIELLKLISVPRFPDDDDGDGDGDDNGDDDGDGDDDDDNDDDDVPEFLKPISRISG